MAKGQDDLPSGMDWVSPYLMYEDAGAAVEWLTRTFGFKERQEKRDTSSSGQVMHAELEHNGDLIMLGGVGPDYEVHHEKNILLYIYVKDVESHFRHSKKSGANILQKPEDADYGDRRYWVEDPGGHLWIFAQHTDQSKA